MTIRVLFFASLREATGCERLELEAPAGEAPQGDSGGADLAWLQAALGRELDPGALERLQASGVRVAVNQELVNGDLRLRDGDEVAFLPPVTGG